MLDGRPFVDLTQFIDAAPLAELDRELAFGLAQMRASCISLTGGSHRSMGIMPPALQATALGDYGEILAAMSDADFALFVSLATPAARVDDRARDRNAWGEDRPLSLSDAQFRFLEYRGVYFPWRVYVELMPGGMWTEKSLDAGKSFTREALTHFPRTVAWIGTLPFASIGSVKLLGLAPLHHGTVHRDGDPALAAPTRTSERSGAEGGTRPDEFVTFCPRGDKRLYIWDERTGAKHYAPSRIYWFDDHEYHGVEADPFFRYSLRVDGTFLPQFREVLREQKPM